MQKPLLVLASAAVAFAAAASVVPRASADGETCSAFFGGLETSKTAVPELVVYNAGGTPLDLTLTIRNDKGQTIGAAGPAVSVPGFHTAFTSLATRLLTAGEGGKPYDGRFSLEVAGPPPFSATTAVVHVTQYIGKRAKDGSRPAKPVAAFVVRPLFPPQTN